MEAERVVRQVRGADRQIVERRVKTTMVQLNYINLLNLQEVYNQLCSQNRDTLKDKHVPIKTKMFDPTAITT